MTDGPAVVDWDGAPIDVTWHRLLRDDDPDREPVDLPHPPKTSNPIGRGPERVADPDAPGGWRLQARSTDADRRPAARPAVIGDGFDRQEGFIHVPLGNSDSVDGDTISLPPERMADFVPSETLWDFDHILDAGDAAKRVLKAYRFPIHRVRVPFPYGDTAHPLAVSFAWAWQGENLLWCEVPHPKEGLVDQRAADRRDTKVYKNVNGERRVYEKAPLTWSRLGSRRLSEYLPPDSPFRWGFAVLNFIRFCQHIESQGPITERRMLDLARAAFDCSDTLTQLHLRRRHAELIEWAHKRKPNAVRQGEVAGAAASARAWESWGKDTAEFIKRLIEDHPNKDDPLYGVSKIYEAVSAANEAKQIGGSGRHLPIPSKDGLRSAMGRWEKAGSIPVWPALKVDRERKARKDAGETPSDGSP